MEVVYLSDQEQRVKLEGLEREKKDLLDLLLALSQLESHHLHNRKKEEASNALKEKVVLVFSFHFLAYLLFHSLGRVYYEI